MSNNSPDDNSPEDLGYTQGQHVQAERRRRQQQRRQSVESSRCRYCNASIYWAKTSSGANMPVDVDPVASGNVMLTLRADDTLLATVVSANNRPGPGRNLYTSHFETCKNYKR